ncbi:hypothetical protein AAG584_19155 [Vreelandella titanicae]|uniref:Uncharacterized protein n=1 Tax=Vreelandella titanicae TaxID=664683 RepID=A0AAP9NM09_9GAMM|nr:hypothetical protein [Halomonas titanicae]QKS24779.1 hypothetical protein FX987_02561 [Halomonas titanicae]SDJ23756.1 hypothetical protein SAMN04487867_12948 [Halomonas titanicae]
MTLRIIVIIAAGAALAACESMPTQPPPPPPAINVYSCATPTGMTEPEGKPLVPVGDYTQKEVALFITALDQWGTRGWLKVARAREHADKCAESESADDEETE